MFYGNHGWQQVSDLMEVLISFQLLMAQEHPKEVFVKLVGLLLN
jgi:hypothetical protein